MTLALNVFSGHLAGPLVRFPTTYMIHEFSFLCEQQKVVMMVLLLSVLLWKWQCHTYRGQSVTQIHVQGLILYSLGMTVTEQSSGPQQVYNYVSI